MGTKTKIRLVPILVVVGAIAVGTQTGTGQEILEDIGIGDGPAPSGMLVPPNYANRVKECTPEQLKKDRRCKDLPIVPVDAARMPYIARHISMAWKAGHPPLLHYESDEGARSKNYAAACSEVRRKELTGSCDEFPFKSTKEGGAKASTHGVPLVEQNRQGGALSRAYTVNKLQDNDEFLVVILNPGKIATEAFKG